MPRPTLYHGTLRNDPTLSTLYKKNLYARDEWQLYDFLISQPELLENRSGYSGQSGVVGITRLGQVLGNPDIPEDEGGAREWYTDQWWHYPFEGAESVRVPGWLLRSADNTAYPSQAVDGEGYTEAWFCVPTLDEQEIHIHDKTNLTEIYQSRGNLSTALKVLIQRFSVWDHPWADGFSTKVHTFLSNAQLYHSCQFSLIRVGPLLDARDYQYSWTNELTRSADYFFNVNAYFPNSEAINFSLTESSTVIITYLYPDGTALLDNSVKCFSKGIKKILLGGSENTFRLPAFQFIPCSVVVSSYPLNENAENIVKNAIKAQAVFVNLEGGHEDAIFYENLEDYAARMESQKIAALESLQNSWIVKDVTFGEVALLYANNNYWANNSALLADINYRAADLEAQETEIDDAYYIENSDGSFGPDMPDSVRIQEIHAALEAQTFSVDPNNNQDRVANIGYYVERIAQVLGISVNPNGSIRSIRPKRRVPDGSTIPGGWSFGQFGQNERGTTQGQLGGNRGEYANGIVYEHKSNKLIKDRFDPEKSVIEGGDLVLCENWIQFFDEFMDDLDKALSWQEIAANGIPSGDGSNKVLLYEGLGTLLAEAVYMLSRISMHTSQSLLCGKVNQGIGQEILQALGTPIVNKAFFEKASQDGAPLAVPYPGFDENAPTITQQLGWILQNVGFAIASGITYDEGEPS